jgi:hypothetical protein
VMGELIATLRRFGELEVSDVVAAALTAVSPAPMDRRLAPDRAGLTLRGCSHTKPGSLFKDAIAIRTWAQWDEVVPVSCGLIWSVMRAAPRSGSTPTPDRYRYRHRLDREPVMA